MVYLVQAIFAVTACYIVAWHPRLILPTAMLSAVFEGAAVANLGSVGVQPYYFVLMLVSVRCLFVPYPPGNLLGRTRGVRRVVGSTMAFAAVCAIGCAVLPRAFAGIPVLSPRLLNPDMVSPLAYSMSNLAQAAYVALNAIFVWWAAHQHWTADDVLTIARWFRVSAIVVLSLGFYQVACYYTGAPFPTDILYSNAGYSMLNEVVAAGMPRVCSTFTEAAGMAVYLLGYLAYATEDLVLGTISAARGWALLIAAFVVLVLSTSSTGYLGLAVLFAWIVLRHGAIPSFRDGIRWKVIAGVGLVVVASLAVILSNADLADVIRRSLFEKQETDSYRARHATDLHALELAFKTYGFGVGLGSNRASGFLHTLIGAGGVIGVAAFGAMALALVASRRSASSFSHTRLAALSAFLAVVGAKAISSPDVSSPVMWVLVAALTGLTGAAEDADPQSQLSRRGRAQSRRSRSAISARPLHRPARVVHEGGLECAG